MVPLHSKNREHIGELVYIFFCFINIKKLATNKFKTKIIKQLSRYFSFQIPGFCWASKNVCHKNNRFHRKKKNSTVDTFVGIL